MEPVPVAGGWRRPAGSVSRRPAARVALVVLLLLSGCGARVTRTGGPKASAGDIRLVVVDSVARTGADDPDRAAAVAAAADLLPRVVAELRSRQVPAVSLASAEGRARLDAAGTGLLILTVTRADPGNTVGRLLIGFGFGKSELEVSAEMFSPKERLTIAGFATEAGSGFKPGLVLPVGTSLVTGGLSLVAGGASLATGLARSPDRDLVVTARAIAQTVAEDLARDPAPARH